MTTYLINAVTNDVYGVAKQDVIGVGNSFEEASLNAMNEIKNTPEMQAFLNEASDRIISWYDGNVAVIKNQVEQAEAEGDYAFALAILSSVPEQATKAYKYASDMPLKSVPKPKPPCFANRQVKYWVKWRLWWPHQVMISTLPWGLISV